MMELSELWPGGPLYAGGDKRFAVCMDSIVLCDFVRAGSARRGADLCSGGGIVTLLLCDKFPGMHVDGVEISGEAAEFSRDILRKNGLSGRANIITADVRNYREIFGAGEYDFIVANPPYFAKEKGGVSEDGGRRTARSEESLTLAQLVAAAAHLCKSGGSVFLVHRAERLDEVFYEMRNEGIMPRRMRLVAHSAEHSPSVALVEGRKSGKTGLEVEPALILKNPDGSDSSEAKRIYRLD